MEGRRTETFHHSPEQVNGYIAQALVLLEAHELSPDERASLLPHTVNLLAAKSITIEQVAAGGMLLPGNARQ